MAKGLLAIEGASTELAEFGLEGVARILDETRALPDVVLMDVQMPDIDGYEATRLIRASARGTSVPILAMTANVMQQDIAAATAAGMNGHIAKPIDLDDLVSKIRSICPSLEVPSADTEVAAENRLRQPQRTHRSLRRRPPAASTSTSPARSPASATWTTCMPK